MSGELNPYASPQLIESTGTPLEGLSQGNPPFVSNRGRAKFVMVGLVVFGVLGVLGLSSSGLQLQMLTAAAVNGGEIGPDEAAWNDNREQAIGFSQLIAYVITAIGFCFWIYRAYQNLPSLRATIRYSAGWAVGSYFVPILNLFRPYQIMIDIWRGSDPAGLTPDEKPVSTAIVGWWWGLWIASNTLGRASFRTAMRAETIDDWIIASWVHVADGLAGVPLTICAFLLVRGINRHQELRHTRLVTASQACNP